MSLIFVLLGMYLPVALIFQGGYLVGVHIDAPGPPVEQQDLEPGRRVQAERDSGDRLSETQPALRKHASSKHLFHQSTCFIKAPPHLWKPSLVTSIKTEEDSRVFFRSSHWLSCLSPVNRCMLGS